MKATNQELLIFHRVASDWLAIHKDADSKFRYALNKMVNPRNGRVSRLKEAYEEKVEDLNVTHASTYTEGEKKNNFIRENGNYSFTREGVTNWNREVRAEYRRKVDVEPFIVEAPKGKDGESLLTDTETLIFEGFVLPSSDTVLEFPTQDTKEG